VSQINSLRAYTDCQALFERALTDPKGARARIGTQEQCINMRTRMHYFRKLDREANAKTYQPDHAMHGTSIYDPYVVRLLPDEDGEWWVYVQPRTPGDMVIEGLSEGGDQLIDANVMDSEAHEIHQLEDQSK
jgi:hypothetical protein